MAPFRKPVPLIVNVKAAVPAVALVGESEVTVGGALLTVKDAAEEVPPPGAGFVTVTFLTPPVAMSPAAIDAANCEALLNVVVLAAPLKFTTDPETKPEPFTVRVNAEPPEIALVGAIDVIPTIGLLIVNCKLGLVPPPGVGLVTATFAVPAVAMSAAAMAAVNWVALLKVVVFVAPLKVTTDGVTKPVPLTVSVKAAPPSVALVGARDVSTGAGLLMLNTCAPDVPPPGAGFVTVTFVVLTVRISEAGTAEVNCVELLNVVALAAPLKFTTELDTKPDPLTVRVKAEPPAIALAGESDASTGAGLFTLKTNGLEVLPPGGGFVTVTFTDPTKAISVAEIAAVSWVEVLNVVTLAAPPKLTTEPETKPEPFTVSVKPAPPATALEGERDVSSTVGLLIVKVEIEDVPPPGAGFVTVTFAEPALRMSEAEMEAVN